MHLSKYRQNIVSKKKKKGKLTEDEYAKDSAKSTPAAAADSYSAISVITTKRRRTICHNGEGRQRNH